MRAAHVFAVHPHCGEKSLKSYARSRMGWAGSSLAQNHLGFLIWFEVLGIFGFDIHAFIAHLLSTKS